MTESEIRQCVTLRQQGLKYAEIARRVGKSQSTVSDACLGLVAPVDARATLAEELRAQGLPWNEVAERTGYANGTSARVGVTSRMRRQRRRAARGAITTTP